MASSLKVITRDSQGQESHYYLHAWDQGEYHQEARIIEQLATHVHVALLAPVDFDDGPHHRVVLKFGRGKKAFGRLEREYEVYTGPLIHLQGSVIPRCYGLFSGTSSTASSVGCLALEYLTPHKQRPVDGHEFHRQVMVSLLKIHQTGINHGNLKTSHILQMGYSPRIIDFSLASRHTCTQGYHSSKLSSCNPYASDPPCEELFHTEHYHLNDEGGIVKRFEQINGVGPSPAVHPNYIPFFVRAVFQLPPSMSNTGVPLAPPNPHVGQQRTKIKDERKPRGHRKNGRTIRARSHSKSRQTQPNATSSSLASRRFAIPTRLDFLPRRAAPVQGQVATRQPQQGTVTRFSIPSYNPNSYPPNIYHK